MALDYRKCAEEIAALIGGGENVVSAAHCATRLRLVIADNDKVQTEKLEEVEGVQGLFESNGQLQLIIGTGTVNKVYDEFLAVTGASAATKEDVKAAAASKMPIWKKMLKSLGDVFVPILPAIVASGLMMGLVEFLGKAVPAFNDSAWFQFLDTVSNTAFTFLPALVAISAARVFGGNLFLGAVIGMLMIHPGLVNAWNIADGYDTWALFGNLKILGWQVFSIPAHGYQGHVIPVIIAVWLMSQLEKWLHKHVPETFDLFVVPLTTVLCTAFITLTVIGPVFALVETWILAFAKWLITVGYGIGALLMGAIYPVTVVFGLHHMYNIIEAGMLGETGLNIWMPIASAANFAQFGACLAVAVKAHKKKTRAVAFPASLSASLGITEPAIFGINFRFMKPFVCGMIGGAAGAFFASIYGTLTGNTLGATAYGVTGIPGFLTINHPLVYTIELLIAAGVAFALTTVVWKEDAVSKKEQKALDEMAAQAPQTELPVITCEAGDINAPVKGNAVPYTEIPDPTFASGILGTGVGINPVGETVFAPYDGTISSVADSKHAIGITGAGDMELLIHVGVDTVEMNGDGFECLVKTGDEVKAGQPLMKFDRAKIAAAGHPDMVVVLLTNADDYDSVDIHPEAEQEGDAVAAPAEAPAMA